MDTSHLTTEQIARFVSPAAIPDPERVRANAHIQICEPCRMAFQQAVRPLAPDFLTSRAVNATEECLDENLMVCYVEGTADAVERDLVAMHLESCAACRTESARLVAFYKAMEEQTAGAEANEQTETAGTQAGALSGLQTCLRAWRRTTRLQWSFALGGYALAGAAITLLLLKPGGPGPQPPAHDAALASKTWQSIQAAQTSHDALARQNQQAEIEHQAVREELAAEKAAHRAALLALASARAQSDMLKKRTLPRPPASGGLLLKTPPHFAAGLTASGQVVADGSGNMLYVVPVDSKESRLLQSRSLDFPRRQLASLAKTVGRTMGDPNEEPICLLRPAATFVSSLRPSFAWQAASQARRYRLTCIPLVAGNTANNDPNSSLNSTNADNIDTKNTGAKRAQAVSYTFSADAAGTQAQRGQAEAIWTVPAGSPALQADTTYTWTVQALDAEGNTLAGSSRHEELFFRTLTVPQLDEVQSKSRQYAGIPLLMGVLYARLGILEDANAAFARYLAANPSDEAAHRMQKQVQAQQAARP